jgi:hypothetical protein
MADKNRGIYRKFEVVRTDGRSAPGEKHHGCRYFVIDVDHDEFAKAAIEAYAKACKKKYPALAKDLNNMNFNKVQPYKPTKERNPLGDENGLRT